jgi:quercetin dioxygenase-like cupin family protein
MAGSHAAEEGLAVGSRIEHRDQPIRRSPSGGPLRDIVSAESGSSDLYVGEQWLAPGDEVPLHAHPVEEVLVCTAGNGLATLGSADVPFGADVSLQVPTGELHGFRNSGSAELRVFVIFPSGAFAETAFEPGEIYVSGGPDHDMDRPV